ncbi:MAG TPA: hypothetical protein DIT64_08495 [Verrucomicrobiales bacterium]|nr:hypothetical protein [Verrucomicrobiales bacterium]
MMNTLCQQHRTRLLQRALRLGCPAADAEDAVQEVFRQLIHRHGWGRFLDLPPAHQHARLDLMLRHHLSNHRRDLLRAKRGGGHEFVPLHEADESRDIPWHLTPDIEMERACLRGTLAGALEKLRHQACPRDWSVLNAWINGSDSADSAHPRRSSGALRTALHRMKARLRALLLREAGLEMLAHYGIKV